MLHEMRELALQDLLYRCKETYNIDITTLTDITTIRQQYGQVLSSLLVEDVEKIVRVYILTPLLEEEMTVEMHVEDLEKNAEKAKKLPFIKPTGAQSPAVGPIIKRTNKPKEQPPYGPSPKILNTTLAAFKQIANAHLEWSAYFQEIVTILNSNTLVYGDKSYSLEQGQNILEQAVKLINENTTVLLAVADRTGKLPGERNEYLQYLAHEMAKIKYVTGATQICPDGTCPLCGKEHVELYPNAVKGAGLNIGNADRAGAFTGLDTMHAWKNFALCIDCADLLYIFKNHILPNFVTQVAGEKALLLPSLLGTLEKHQKFIQKWQDYIQILETNKIASYEKGVLKFFTQQQDNQVTLQIIWAKFGQNMEDIKGWITDILPSKLRKLADLNDELNRWEHPIKPQHPVDEAQFDLGLNMLLPLFRRPGGKSAKNANASKQLSDFRQRLANAIYHQQLLKNNEIDYLYYQITETARWYLMDIIKRKDDYGLTNEGYSEKKNTSFFTLAGWIRHLARFLYYLDQTGVLKMEKGNLSFEPQTETLKPFFTEGSGINSDAKAFAFILGALFGKLIQTQSMKGVNVNSNALMWLKRLELSGKDLPELYTKIRSKFFAYDFKKSQLFLDLEADLSNLGAKLGDSIELDKTKTCYFLLLGQSLSKQILPSASKKDKNEDN